VPVTVKMRRGIDDTPESAERFERIFEAAFEAGVAAVTVHGRTVTQRYVGPSNWDFLRDLKRRHPHRVVLGSGDLFDAACCLRMMEYTGVDGVTVARGAIGNPWVFRQAADLAAGRPPHVPRLHEQRQVIAEHFRLSVETYGPERAVRTMRKFGIQYAQLHPNSLAVRDAFVQARKPDEWDAVLTEWYAEDLPGRLPPVDEPNPRAGMRSDESSAVASC
jgi:tRNA-dihydrouridine synthase